MKNTTKIIINYCHSNNANSGYSRNYYSFKYKRA